MTRIVLDTDVVSLYRSGRLPAGYRRRLAGREPCIAVTTAGELWKGALAARWGDVRRGALGLWLDQATVLPVDLKVAFVWGAITASGQRRGRPRPTNDAWIAACCIEGGLPLLTLTSVLLKAGWGRPPSRTCVVPAAHWLLSCWTCRPAGKVTGPVVPATLARYCPLRQRP